MITASTAGYPGIEEVRYGTMSVFCYSADDVHPPPAITGYVLCMISQNGLGVRTSIFKSGQQLHTASEDKLIHDMIHDMKRHGRRCSWTITGDE